jgi:putative phosphoesterase
MRSASRSVSVGLISDTHGLLRPEALTALEGSRHIVHAGDIGDPAVLEALRRIAPVTAVRGNNDRESWARKLRDTEALEIAGTRIFVIHDLSQLELDPAAEGFDVVVAGHSHRPRNELVNGVLYVNPGSAGPRRFKLPVTVARLMLPARSVSFETLYPGNSLEKK